MRTQLNRLSLATASSSLCSYKQGAAAVITSKAKEGWSQMDSPLQKATSVQRSKIATCLSGKFSLMWGNIIYLLDSLPNPEGIRSLQCLSPERAKSCTDVDVLWWGFFVVVCCCCGGFSCLAGWIFLVILQGDNLWCDLARSSTLFYTGGSHISWGGGIGGAAQEEAEHQDCWMPTECMEKLIHWGKTQAGEESHAPKLHSPNNTEIP